MANFNSDNLTSGNAATVWTSADKTPGQISHARKRNKRMEIAGTPVAGGPGANVGDTMVMGLFKSGDLLNDLLLSSNSATPITGAIDIGLYVAGLDKIPVAPNIIDVDLFASAQLVTAVLDRQDVLIEAGTLAAIDRGKTLWEMAALGAASYTEDPMEDWMIVMTFTAVIDAAQDMLLEANFISFG